MAPPRLQGAGVEVYAIASGSSGNCTLIKTPAANILIDAGVGINRLSAALRSRGVAAQELDAIFITHEHIDHISGLIPIAKRGGAIVVANNETLAACAERDNTPVETLNLAIGETIKIRGLAVRSFPVPHDAVSPVGYEITCRGASIAYITDAGSVTDEMRTAVAASHLAIIEANHDVEWLRRGPYTADMKARVRSPTGHLSNDQCADLAAEALGAGGPKCIWLAHLSRVNNSPSLARRAVETAIRARTDVHFSLDIALRDNPSARWVAGANPVQLRLF